MNPVESFLQLIGSREFAESIFSGVAGGAAYDAVKPTIEKITRSLAGKPASEDELRAALEELMIQIGAHTNLNINQLRAEVLAAIGQKSAEIPHALTRYIPIAADDCIGRGADLRRLDDTLRRSPKVVVVNGLGGIGKTTLAKAWLYQALEGYDHFAWIEMAGNDDAQGQRAATFLETVAYHPDLADNLRLSFGEKEPPENRFHHIMNALRQLKGRNLLVVDNAGPDLEQKEIREQLPLPPAWQVLVTSRSKLHGYELVPLDRLLPQHAAELFCLHFTGSVEGLDELLREVDYHTLTVELLAKTLENHLGSLTISELTAKLKRRELADADLQRRISLNHSAEETEVYLHLLATFDVADLNDEERLLLARFAALPPGGAYSAAQLEKWLQIHEFEYVRLQSAIYRLENKSWWMPRWFAKRFRNALHQVRTKGVFTANEKNVVRERRLLQETLLRLDRKGWLTRSAQNTFSLHRMIQQVALYQLQPGLAELAVLVEIFTKKLAFDASTNYTLLFQWIPYAEQVLATLQEEERGHEDVSRLMNNCGIVYLNLGQYERARDLLEEALASDLKNFGKEHPNVAVRQSNLANVYSDLGQYERARDLLEEALASAVKNFGKEHPNVAVRQSNLALVYKELGDYERARDLLEEALASDLKNFGKEHPNVAVSQSNLANVYSSLGQYERARDLLEEALASDLKNFGKEHPNVAVSQIGLGAVFLKTGEKEKARELFEQAYRLRQRILGEQHPATQNAKRWLESV